MLNLIFGTHTIQSLLHIVKMQYVFGKAAAAIDVQIEVTLVKWF
jgi:hypothetical protein